MRAEGLQYLIGCDGQTVGYAIVLADKAHLAPGVEFELLDFYILPRFRGLGIGRRAASQLFDRHHEVWQIFELARNLPARAFWQRTIEEYTDGDFESLDGGTQQRFRN